MSPETVVGPALPHPETMVETAIVESGPSMKAGSCTKNTTDSKVDLSYSLNVELCCSASNKLRPDERRAPARRPPAAHRIALSAAAFR